MAFVKVSVHATRPAESAGERVIEVLDGYLEIAHVFDVLNEPLETLYHEAFPSNREATLRRENADAGPKKRDEKGDLVDRVSIRREVIETGDERR